MDHQAKAVKRDGVPDGASQGLAWDVGGFANDVLKFAELHSQLLLADVRECGRRVLVPSLLLFGGLILGMACFPIALVAGTFGLVQVMETSHLTAFLLVLIAGAICSVLLVVVGLKQVRQRASVLRRSRDELMRNLRLIKQVGSRNRLT